MPRSGLPRPGRRASSAVLGLLLTLAVAVGSAGPAGAEPTETPSATASPTPSVQTTQTPVPGATPTEPATPKPIAPSTTESAEPAAPKKLAKRRSFDQAIAELPPRWQRLVAARTTGAAKARLSARAAGENYVSLVFAECARGTGPVNVQIAAIALGSDEAFTLDYTVNLPGGRVLRSGTLVGEVGDGFAITTVSVPTRGSYESNVVDPEGELPLTDVFGVFDCITDTPICQAVTFTNPVANPAVEVVYGDPESDEDDYDSIILEPGESTRVRTDLARLDYFSFVSDNGGDPAYSVSSAGEGTPDVTQNCDPEVVSTALVGCSTGDSPATVELTVAHLATQRIRYAIFAPDGPDGTGGEPVASGEAGPGTESSQFSESLTGGVGLYRYELYLDGSDDPYETVQFRVLSCVTVTATCRAVTFDNPIDNPDVVVSYGSAADPTSDDVTVEPDESERITWRQSSLTYAAAADPEADFVELATPSAAEQITVPPCATDPGNGSGSGSGSGDGLADTGSPATGLLALLIGLLLTVAGGVTLTRRRGRA